MKGSKFQAWIEKHILPIANKIANQRHLRAIQSSFMSAMPFMMIGSFALILAEPPVDYTTLATSNIFYGFLKGWASFASVAADPLYLLYGCTLGCLSLYVCAGISYFLSKRYKLEGYIPIIISLASFLMLCSIRTDAGFSRDWFGGEGLFAAMVISLLTTEGYRFLIEHKVGNIKMPDGVPPALSTAFSSLFPAAIITILAMLISIGIKFTPYETFPALIFSFVTPLIHVIDNVFGAAIASILTMVLWWFGIHDTAIGAVLSPIRDSNYAMNAAAYAAGTSKYALPYIFTSPFWWVFVAIGGSGATFALAIMLVRSKSKQLKEVGKLGIIPAFFNINEPILFGVPLILNPLFFFPFVFAQTFNAIITYLLMQTGIVAHTFAEPGWNMFAPIGAFISTLDWKAVVLVLCLIVLDGLVYYPFFKVYEKQMIKEETSVAPIKESEKTK